MPRKRDPNRDKAFSIFLEHKGDITNRAIAQELNVLEKTISAWKSRDKWVNQLDGEDCSTTKKKRSTTKKQTKQTSPRDQKKQQVIQSLVEAGTYSPALDLMIEIYLDAYEEYSQDKSEKLRKELAKYLGQLGLDGKNKDLLKKNRVPLDKSEKEGGKSDDKQQSKLVQFRQRVQR